MTGARERGVGADEVMVEGPHWVGPCSESSSHSLSIRRVQNQNEYHF